MIFFEEKEKRKMYTYFFSLFPWLDATDQIPGFSSTFFVFMDFFLSFIHGIFTWISAASSSSIKFIIQLGQGKKKFAQFFVRNILQ